MEDKIKTYVDALGRNLYLMETLASVSDSLDVVATLDKDVFSEGTLDKLQELREGVVTAIADLRVIGDNLSDDMQKSLLFSPRAYHAIMIDASFIERQTEKASLLGFPIASEYADYKLWINNKFITVNEDKRAEIRFYDKYTFELNKYTKNEAGKFEVVDSIKLNADQFKELLGKMIPVSEMERDIDVAS